MKVLAVDFIRRKVMVDQCHSLLGRMEGLGSGAVIAAGRRRKAWELERLWRQCLLDRDTISYAEGFLSMLCKCKHAQSTVYRNVVDLC